MSPSESLREALTHVEAARRAIEQPTDMRGIGEEKRLLVAIADAVTAVGLVLEAMEARAHVDPRPADSEDPD